MDIVKFMKDKMLYIVFVLMFVASYAGIYNRDLFVSLKWTLPIALFLMLFQPMVYLDLKKAFTKRTSIKTKYLILLTAYYVAIFPLLTYALLDIWIAAMPHADPKLLAGVVLIGLAPLPSSAPAFTHLAGGKVQLTLVGVVWTFILSLVVMPVYAALILHTVIKVPIWLLLQSLILYIITPLVLGQILKYATLKYKGEEILNRMKEPLVGLSLLGLYWMVTEVFGINGLMIAKKPEIIAIGAIVMNVYFLIRFALSYFSGKALKFPLDQNISLVYSSGSNMTIATAIAIGTFGSLAAVGTALGGPFSDMILMILLVRVFNKIRESHTEETVQIEEK